MKPERIPSILKAFENNADRAILINGRWGVGKTYQLLAHISGQSKKEKKEKKYVYVSMFGKETIDDIHTELFAKINTGKHVAKKIIKMIPKVAPLIVDGVDLIESLQYALKTETNTQNQEDQTANEANPRGEVINKLTSRIKDFVESFFNNKIKKRKKKKIIVILDDFERLDFYKISIETLMGYFHTLILQQIKVVVACNEGEILKYETVETKNKTIDKYKDFREKVFDRKYTITSSNEEIMRSYWGDDNYLLDDLMIREMQDNLRLSSRASQFYGEVKSTISKANENIDKVIDKKDLIRSSIYIVVGTYTNEYQSRYEKDLLKAKDNYKKKILEGYTRVLSEDFHGEISEKVGKIQYVACYLSGINSPWLLALCKLYYFNDDMALKELLNMNNDYERNPLRKEVTFLSHSEKEKWFERQIDYIFHTSKFSPSHIEASIARMVTYKYMNDMLMDQIVSHIIDNKEYNIDWIKELYYHGETYCYEGSMLFIKKLLQRFEESEYEDFLETIRIAWAEKHFGELHNYLLQPPKCAIKTECNMYGFKSEVIAFFKENNYLLCDLKGTITQKEWYVCLAMRKLARENGFWDDMKAYIETMTVDSDPTVDERKRILLRENE